MSNKEQTLKLYTEEQVKLMIEKSRETGLTAEFLTLTTPPIELPSDEEIQETFTFYPQMIEGAKWVIKQIKKQK